MCVFGLCGFNPLRRTKHKFAFGRQRGVRLLIYLGDIFVDEDDVD